MRKSNGSSFQSPVHWAIQRGTWDQDTQWLPGDFNRDGRDDLASVRQDGTGATFEVHLSTGSAFAASALWMYRDGTWDNGIKWDAGDFDGDQRDDILAVWNDGGSNTLTVRRSTGNNFQARHWAIRQGGWNNATELVAADYNGDGYSDVAAIWPDGNNTSIAVFPSDGVNFPGFTQWSVRDGGWVGDQGRWSAGDFDVLRRDLRRAVAVTSREHAASYAGHAQPTLDPRSQDRSGLAQTM